MTMGPAEFLIIFLLLVFSGPVALVVCGAVGALLEEARNDGGTPCTPSRHANITASKPQAQRRVLGPPAGWHEPQHVAIVPAPAAVEVDDIDDWDDQDDELPLVVEDWPTPQTVEPPAVVPVVPRVTINHTAARFAFLEVRR